jgi:hypothetical protein
MPTLPPDKFVQVVAAGTLWLTNEHTTRSVKAYKHFESDVIKALALSAGVRRWEVKLSPLRSEYRMLGSKYGIVCFLDFRMELTKDLCKDILYTKGKFAAILVTDDFASQLNGMLQSQGINGGGEAQITGASEFGPNETIPMRSPLTNGPTPAPTSPTLSPTQAPTPRPTGPANPYGAVSGAQMEGRAGAHVGGQQGAVAWGQARAKRSPVGVSIAAISLGTGAVLAAVSCIVLQKRRDRVAVEAAAALAAAEEEQIPCLV